LVKEKNHTLAKYALSGYTNPIGVAEWEKQITLKPENLFMGRVGAKVSTQTQQAFKWLCFGISPENA
jgi:hypothetical protein